MMNTANMGENLRRLMVQFGTFHPANIQKLTKKE